MRPNDAQAPRLLRCEHANFRHPRTGDRLTLHLAIFKDGTFMTFAELSHMATPDLPPCLSADTTWEQRDAAEAVHRASIQEVRADGWVWEN